MPSPSPALFRCLVVVGLIAASVAFSETSVRGVELSASDLKEIQRIEAALDDGTLPQPPGWWLNHGASPEGVKELEAVGYPEQRAGLATVAWRAGGWAEYKLKVAGLLKSEDLVVRGFAALWLADLGDRRYATDLLRLLQEKRSADPDGFPRGHDQAYAAIGLGVLGAREHAPALVAQLKNPDSAIRGGAAEGLSWMQATDHHKEIAALLEDDGREVALNAMVALARLGRTEYADRFVEIAAGDGHGLGRGIDDDRIALTALVMLKAKDQAPKIAKLLERKDDYFKRVGAIQFLALLDCRDYAPQLVKLLDDNDYAIRQHALVALGVLRQAESTPRIAEFLKSDDRSDRQAAAWALIYMESAPHLSQAVAVYSQFEIQQAGIGISRPDVEARALKKRFEAALERAEASVKTAPK
jgi:HEAT repeat protein